MRAVHIKECVSHVGKAMVLSHDKNILSYVIKVCSCACLEEAFEKLTPAFDGLTCFGVNSLTGFGVNSLTGCRVWLLSGFTAKLKRNHDKSLWEL